MEGSPILLVLKRGQTNEEEGRTPLALKRGQMEGGGVDPSSGVETGGQMREVRRNGKEGGLARSLSKRGQTKEEEGLSSWRRMWWRWWWWVQVLVI